MVRAGILRTLHPLQLQAECSAGAFHHGERDGGDHIELAEVECDVDTIKKLKLGQRSSLWSRPNSTTSQLQQEHQQQQHQQQQQQQQQQQRQQQQPPHKRAHSKSPQPQQQQPLQQQRPQQHSPAPGQKLLSEKSDYSISV
ncbi:hypothetical protein AWZ03_005085 [Drosophila navojoa]|uniref:Uncharacterized protein n=1 Tax=Drosophila navojoa TaxID=7232 RepID=A0A484BLC7_DRONA|nr:hypothetical protein AWZ03_005085 [Drosophila navojoa]